MELFIRLGVSDICRSCHRHVWFCLTRCRANFVAAPHLFRLSNFLSDLQIHELISKLKLFEMESSEMSVRHIRVSKFGIANRAPTLQKKTFVSHYADSLVEIMFDKTECNTVAEEEAGDGNVAVVDMAFQNLNLAVGSGENAINVVNSLTGRIKAKTMTALVSSACDARPWKCALPSLLYYTSSTSSHCMFVFEYTLYSEDGGFWRR